MRRLTKPANQRYTFCDYVSADISKLMITSVTSNSWRNDFIHGESKHLEMRYVTYKFRHVSRSSANYSHLPDQHNGLVRRKLLVGRSHCLKPEIPSKPCTPWTDRCPFVSQFLKRPCLVHLMPLLFFDLWYVCGQI